ncbi:MAG: hypothetical protein RL110_170, partial [Bacteroidota bacterium]
MATQFSTCFWVQDAKAMASYYE